VTVTQNGRRSTADAHVDVIDAVADVRFRRRASWTEFRSASPWP
jgi:hypothetical protein